MRHHYLIISCLVCSISLTAKADDAVISGESISAGVDLTSEQMDKLNEQTLNSWMRNFQDLQTLNKIMDLFADDQAKEEAEDLTPPSQMNRTAAINPLESRGPFEVTSYPKQLTVLAFFDSYGDPWPLTEKPTNPNEGAYKFTWASGAAAHLLQVTPVQPYVTTTIGVMLEGQNLPLMFNLKNSVGAQDLTVKYTVTGMSPTSGISSRLTVAKQLNPPKLEQFISGAIPATARALSLTGNTGSIAWEYEGNFILKTRGELIYPTDPWGVASDPDDMFVFYAFKESPDAISIQFGGRQPLTLGVN